MVKTDLYMGRFVCFKASDPELWYQTRASKCFIHCPERFYWLHSGPKTLQNTSQMVLAMRPCELILTSSDALPFASELSDIRVEDMDA